MELLKQKNVIKITFAIFILFSKNILAEHAAFKLPVYGGSACPKEKTIAILSPNAAALSIVFEDYKVEVGARYNRNFTRKNCQIKVPIEIPSGQKVRLIGADYRGFNNLPCMASMTLSTQYVSVQHKTALFEKTFIGPIRGESFIVRHKLKDSDSNWSSCGGEEFLLIESSISIANHAEQDDAFSTIDSLDLVVNYIEQGGITLYLEWADC